MDYYVCLYQNNLWLFMFEMHLISDITDGLNIKTRPLPSLFFGICYFFISVDYFFAFFGMLSGGFGFFIAVQYQSYYCFSPIF